MQHHKQILGTISLTAFAITLFIVFLFTCFQVLQDAVDYLVTNISAYNNSTTYR
jgi:hypothetical protein